MAMDLLRQHSLVYATLATTLALLVVGVALWRLRRRLLRSEQERRRAAEELNRRLSELFSLQELSYVLSDSLELDRIVEQVVRYAVRFLDAQGALLALLGDAPSDPLQIAAAEGTLAALRGQQIQGDDPGLVARSTGREHLELIRNSGAAPTVIVKGFQAAAAAAVPLRSHGIVIGTLIITDPKEGVFVPEDMPLQSVVGTPLGEALLGKTSALQELLAATRRGDRPAPLVARSERLKRAVRVNAARIPGAATEQSIVVMVEDVTDQQALETQLVQSEKLAAVGQLVSGVAHELNNPLTSIAGLSEFLLEQKELGKKDRGHLQVIQEQAERASRIVRNLLTFARKGAAERVPVDLNDVIRRTLSLTSYDLKLKDIVVERELSGALPDVFGDRHGLQQAVLNLVTNAAHAVAENPRERPREITVSTWFDGQVHLRVADTRPAWRRGVSRGPASRARRRRAAGTHARPRHPGRQRRIDGEAHDSARRRGSRGAADDQGAVGGGIGDADAGAAGSDHRRHGRRAPDDGGDARASRRALRAQAFQPARSPRRGGALVGGDGAVVSLRRPAIRRKVDRSTRCEPHAFTQQQRPLQYRAVILPGKRNAARGIDDAPPRHIVVLGECGERPADRARGAGAAREPRDDPVRRHPSLGDVTDHAVDPMIEWIHKGASVLAYSQDVFQQARVPTPHY